MQCCVCAEEQWLRAGPRLADQRAASQDPAQLCWVWGKKEGIARSPMRGGGVEGQREPMTLIKPGVRVRRPKCCNVWPGATARSSVIGRRSQPNARRMDRKSCVSAEPEPGGPESKLHQHTCSGQVPRLRDTSVGDHKTRSTRSSSSYR